MALHRVGYWRQVGRSECPEPGDERLPDPRALVDPAWDPDVRSRVASYLKAGIVTAYGMGYSYCRFHCDIPDWLMGSRDLTDGVWIWPEGLAHYVEVHSVRPPPEFLSHLRQRDFKVPSDAEVANLHDPGDEEGLTASALYESLRKGWFDTSL